MNKEELRSPSVERAVERPAFLERPMERPTRFLPRYEEADVWLSDFERLEKVRRELGGLTVININTPAQAEGAPQEEMPKTFFDLFLGFIALSLIKAGEFMESLGEKKEA